MRNLRIKIVSSHMKKSIVFVSICVNAIL